MNAMDNTTNMIPKMQRNASSENMKPKRITIDNINVNALEENIAIENRTARNSQISNSYEEEKVAGFSAFDNSMSDGESDVTSVSAASSTNQSTASGLSRKNSIPEFKAADHPVKYMTAADFEKRVCNQLSKISASYDKSAARYEKAIAQTEKTIKVCNNGIAKIDRFNRIQQKNLNDGFKKIAVALATEMEGAAQQWFYHALILTSKLFYNNTSQYKLNKFLFLNISHNLSLQHNNIK